MFTRDKFTDEEWRVVELGALSAGAGVMMADFGVVSVLKEAAALAEGFHKLKEEYPDSQLVQALSVEKNQQIATANQPHQKREPAKETAERMLRQVEAGARLVESKVPEAEARAYKEFTYALAEKVANASGEGWFGLGKKVSDDEDAYLGEIRKELRM